MLKASERSFYKASVPYPHRASSPPSTKKNIPRLLSGRKCSGVCQNAVVWVGASLRRLCATAIVHPCTSCLLCWFRIVRNFGQALSRILAFAVVWVGASLHRQPFVPLHRATALCGCLYASLHSDFGRPLSCILCTFMNALLVSHHCLVSRLGCHIVWQLSAADFKHPCLKLWAFIL